MIIAQMFVGWPAILCFLALATAGAWKPSKILLAAALALCLPTSFYLFGGNGWIQLAAFYLPIGIGASIYLIEKKRIILPKLILVPAYVFYAWLGFVVLSQ